MAINISPIKDIIKATIDYKVYSGNLGLTPVDIDKGAVVITCTGSYPTSTPLHSRRLGKTEDTWDDLTIINHEYTYQIDIMRGINLMPYGSPLIPFEKEAYTIINKIHSEMPRLARVYNLGLTRIRCRQFMDTSNYEKPVHRLVGNFSIYSESLVKIRTPLEKVECTQVTYKLLRGDRITL